MESVAWPSHPAVRKVEPTTSHFPSPHPRLFLCRWGISGHLERVGRLKKDAQARDLSPGASGRVGGQGWQGQAAAPRRRLCGRWGGKSHQPRSRGSTRPKSGPSVQRRLPRSPRPAGATRARSIPARPFAGLALSPQVPSL